MPSGAPAGEGEEGAGAARLGTGLPQERTDRGRAGAVGEAGAAGTGETVGRARTGAEAAMQSTTPVGHGRLAARAATAGAGAAAGSGEEIAGAVAVLQPAAAVERKRKSRRRQNRTFNPMPSGDNDP